MAQGSSGGKITSWEVVCSGFFDSIGLYSHTPVTLEHELIALGWIERLGLGDLVQKPVPKKLGNTRSRDNKNALSQNFFHL